VIAPALAGLLLGLSLIVAIGAQNAYVLRQGLARSHVGIVVAFCACSDLVLIAAGISGVGALVDHAPWLIGMVRWLGVAFLLWYAAATLRRVARPGSLETAEASLTGSESRARVVGRAAALTWFNPHVYLDTVLLVGSVAAAHNQAPGGRWFFAAGAAAASAVWFASLGLGARLLAPRLKRPGTWRLLDTTVAGTMLFAAARLALA
jgi:L-lysine exporter family protein LysE/ArgO